MAAPRLPFLWPMLFRASGRSARKSRHVVPQSFHTTSRMRQNAVQQRYGTANEPPPHIGQDAKVPLKNDSSKTAAQAKSSATDEGQTAEKTENMKPIQETTSATNEAMESSKTAIADKAATTKLHDDPMMDTSNSVDAAKPADKPTESLLDSVPDPAQVSAKNAEKSSEKNESDKIIHDEHQPPIHAPHMSTPQHVHHFDTFGLVRRLEESGFKDNQAIDVMKAMRLMLSDNMDLARDALVSKSQVENETYLFKAACSELRTEVITRRKGEQEKMRAQRAQLQHEVDILNQRLSQDSVALKDDLKGMFDDRKMAVRNEQRDMERKIQELNYKITVSLQADSRSDVEGLRWIMTRRVIITLAVIVVMVLGSLKLSSNTMHERELEKKRKANMRSAGTQVDEAGDAGLAAVGDMVVKEGDNPAFVSLG